MKLPTLYDGTGLPAPEQFTLKAGALSLVFEAGMLRNIRVGTHEIVRGVYAAVRDQNWGTVPAQLHDLQIEADEDSFRITFTSDHRQNGIHFSWHGEIVGSPDSRITFSFDGEAKTSFNRNRVGFCILHPMDTAGVSCAIEHTDGSTEQGNFPQAIAPHQPFFDIRSITHDVMPGIRAEVRMEGDTFEMEDQRNWIDASYKTYCTPLSIPFPVMLETGAKVQQQIMISLVGQVGSLSVHDPAPTLQVNPGRSPVKIPPIGLSAASHEQPLTERQIRLLKGLHLAHLRVDLEPHSDVQAVLRRAMHESQALGCALEVAVHAGEDAGQSLSHVAAAAESLQPDVVRWLVFDYHQQGTRLETVQAARRILGKFGASIGSGTDCFFTELNRNRPQAELLDWAAYSINPQVHAFDNGSLIETLQAAGVTVESTRTFSHNARIAVTPVTFKMRWNPNSTAPETPPPPEQLPHQVDVRQMSLFGAVWTLGSLKSLAAAGADSLTYYETTGWLGVMEHEGGCSLPRIFASVPGGIYPMYHIFAAVGAFAGGEMLPLVSSHPLKFDGLILRSAGKTRILIANYTAEPQTFSLSGLDGQFTQKLLDEFTAEEAIHNPEMFWEKPGTRISAPLQFRLSPYAVAFLDQQ